MNRAAYDELLKRWTERPWEPGFFQICRWLEARSPGLPRLGEGSRPGQEDFRLGQTPSPLFAPREVAELSVRQGRVHVSLFGLGLFGPNGPLPLYLTEEAHNRLNLHHDRTLSDFLDMFHHRWLSLMYRAWANGQSAAGLDRPDDERFSRYIAGLSGRGSNEAHDSGLEPHALLAGAGKMIGQIRTPEGLESVIGHYWGLPFRIEEYVFHWLKLEPEDRSRLGRTPQATLGMTAVLGSHVPDRQSMFVIRLGPLSLADYIKFLPSGQELPKLVAWVREFAGLELEWALHLSLLPEETPRCALGGPWRLGRTVWLARRDQKAPVRGKRFSPESVNGIYENPPGLTGCQGSNYGF